MIVRLAGLLGAVGVALGAFGAHALRGHVTDEMLEIWRTAVSYHLVHAVALFAMGLAGTRVRLGHIAGAAFGLGILVFSGTLYALVLTGARWLGAVTPIGGVAFIVGWATVFVGGVEKRT